MIEVTVKTLDGKNRAFSVPDEITVKQFKKTIAGSIEIKAEIQRLIFKGRILCDDRKINDYDVNGKTIHVVQKYPPCLAASTTAAATTTTSSDPLPSRSRDSDSTTTRSGQRIFLGSYSLASEGSNIVRRILDDIGEASGQSSRLQNPEEGSSANGAAVASPSRGSSNEAQNRINSIKKLLASVKRTLDLLETPNAENDVTTEENEQSVTEQLNSFEQTSSSSNVDNNAGQDAQNVSSAVLGDLLDELMLVNERLQPHLVQYQQVLREQSVYRKKSRKYDNAQQLCTLVSRAMHYIGHIHHGLSDLSIDIGAAPPRNLVVPCQRPHVPVLQAEISLSGGPLMIASSAVPSSGSGSSTSTTSTLSAEGIDSTNGITRSRIISIPARSEHSTTSAGAQMSTAGSSSLSSIFPLFFSSDSSFLPSTLPPWLSSPSTTSSSATSSSTTTSLVSSSSTATPSTTTSATENSARSSGSRRGYRRFSEVHRRRPSVSISNHDAADQGLHHFDPYLVCHSRHFRSGSSAQFGNSNNSSQSLSDIISSLVNNIMSTTGESSADTSATGQPNNDDDGPVTASFTTHFDSPMRALHEQLLDDPEVEEEVIGSWHPLDSDGAFVRNIFGSSERSNDLGRSDHQPRSSAATTLEDFFNLMSNGARSEENWLELLICRVLNCFSFSDVVTILSGNPAPLVRLRQPLQEFITSTVLSGEEATDDNMSRAVDRLMEDSYMYLEEIAGDAEPLRDVDFTNSLSSFLRHHLKKIFNMIMKSTAEDTGFDQELFDLCWQLGAEFVYLCEGCLRSDGFVTLMQNQLFFPYGVHSVIGTWARDQFRSFQRSVLQHPLQSEQHIVYYPPTSSTDDTNALGTSASTRERQTPHTAVKDTEADTVMATETVASVESIPGSSTSNQLAKESKNKENSRRVRKASTSQDENLPEHLAAKHRKTTSSFERQNGLEARPIANGENGTIELPSSETRMMFSQDFPCDGESFTSSERLCNGLEATTSTLPDVEEVSKSK